MGVFGSGGWGAEKMGRSPPAPCEECRFGCILESQRWTLNLDLIKLEKVPPSLFPSCSSKPSWRFHSWEAVSFLITALSAQRLKLNHKIGPGQLVAHQSDLLAHHFHI